MSEANEDRGDEAEGIVGPVTLKEGLAVARELLEADGELVNASLAGVRSDGTVDLEDEGVLAFLFRSGEEYERVTFNRHVPEGHGAPHVLDEDESPPAIDTDAILDSPALAEAAAGRDARFPLVMTVLVLPDLHPRPVANVPGFLLDATSGEPCGPEGEKE